MSNEITEVLADIYPTESDARRVADEIRLATAHIDFDGSAIKAWTRVIAQAKREDKFRVLLDHVHGEYPNQMTPSLILNTLKYMSPSERSQPRYSQAHPNQYAQYMDLSQEQKINQLYEIALDNRSRGVIQNVWLIFLTAGLLISQLLWVGLVFWMVGNLR